MERILYHYLIFLLLSQILCSGSSRTENEETRHVNVQRHEVRQQSTVQKDITTPITTIPTISTPPFLNPNSNPDTFSPTSTFPFTTPNTMNSYPIYSGSSWCVASPSASLIALQVALDYACGYGGTDCSAIQPGGSCYNPSSIHDHASYAFNKYYHKNPLPNSCNFGGTALITSTNPSTVACQYPPTSTSSSILNTTNSSGANVFGSVPVPTNPSPSAAPHTFNSFADFCIIIWIISFLENIFSKFINFEKYMDETRASS